MDRESSIPNPNGHARRVFEVGLRRCHVDVVNDVFQVFIGPGPPPGASSNSAGSRWTRGATAI